MLAGGTAHVMYVGMQSNCPTVYRAAAAQSGTQTYVQQLLAMRVQMPGERLQPHSSVLSINDRCTLPCSASLQGRSGERRLICRCAGRMRGYLPGFPGKDKNATMWNQFGIGIAPYLGSCSQNGVLRMVICSADRCPTRAERGEASGAAARLPCWKIPHPPRE